jgi:hypothetical protein
MGIGAVTGQLQGYFALIYIIFESKPGIVRRHGRADPQEEHDWETSSGQDGVISRDGI